MSAYVVKYKNGFLAWEDDVPGKNPIKTSLERATLFTDKEKAKKSSVRASKTFGAFGQVYELGIKK